MGDAGAKPVMVGGGGHAGVVAEALAQPCVGHIAPSGGSGAAIGPWLGDDDRLADLAESRHVFVLGIGFVDRVGAVRRAAILEKIDDAALKTVCHQRAIISPSATLAAGAFVGAGAIVGTGTDLGIGAIVNSGAVIDHDCRIAANVHVGPGAVVSGGVEIGANTLIGVGATIRQNVRIGAEVVVGAGAVVVASVPDGVTVVGVPARAHP